MVSKRTLLIVVVCAVVLQILILGVAFNWSAIITASAKSLWGGGMDPTVAERRVEWNFSSADSLPLETYLEQRAMRVREVDCRQLFLGNQTAMRTATALEHQQQKRGGRERAPSDTRIHQLATNCSLFLQHYRFLLHPLTRLEEQFPIAFSVIAYKQASQVVDLLRAVYRPQNWYCLHVDKKSSPPFRQAMEAVSRCFPNVFLASRAIDVHWGLYSVLEPELVCMEDLWKNSTWKYFINLTGQEFPLRTNYELVRILSAFRGANDVDGFVPNKKFVNYRWKKYLPAPHGIQLYRGSVHIVASRGFVDYVLHAPEALAFRQWCKPTRHPDEHFFNSLNHNPHLRVPGGSKGPTAVPKKGTGSSGAAFSPTLARFKVWREEGTCPGKFVRNICILSVPDLPRLRSSDKLFANKFHADYSRLALRCLAEDLHNRTTEQTLGRSEFDVTFYQQQPLVKNRLS